jgi:hypothetical protein
MGFEEGECGREKASFTGPHTKLLDIQSGEVKEPPGAPFVGEGCGERGKGQRFRVHR